MYVRILGIILCSYMVEPSSHYLCVFCSFSVNYISDEGASALAESLKQNTTLTELNIECMSEFWEPFLAATRWNQAHTICACSVHFQLITSATREPAP